MAVLIERPRKIFRLLSHENTTAESSSMMSRSPHKNFKKGNRIALYNAFMHALLLYYLIIAAAETDKCAAGYSYQNLYYWQCLRTPAPNSSPTINASTAIPSKLLPSVAPSLLPSHQSPNLQLLRRLSYTGTL